MKKYFLIFALLGTGLMFVGCEPGKDVTKPADTAEIMEDQFQPQYGEKDPIALNDAKTGGTFTTWGGSFPKSLNMFLDYNRFSATVMGLLYEPLLSLHSTDNKPVGVLAESWEIADQA